MGWLSSAGGAFRHIREGDRRHRQRPTPSIDRRRFDRRLAENQWAKEDFLIVSDQRKGARESRK